MWCSCGMELYHAAYVFSVRNSQTVIVMKLHGALVRMVPDMYTGKGRVFWCE